MIADCFKYYKGCQVCQKFGDLQLFLQPNYIISSSLGLSEDGDCTL
jgi:hypothetical protein